MGTTADKLNAILNTKEAIKQAIRDKGVYIGDHDAFAEYPDAIRSIETGSSEGGSDEFFNMRTDNGTNMCALFCYYPGNELDLSVLDTSKAINMSMMFSYCFSISSLDLSSFDTRNVCNMSQMFSYSNFNNINLSSFDTGNVYDMNNMFAGCNGLTSLDLSHFNTSNVNDMNGMFNNCSSLSSLDLSGFNTSNVTNMNYMFAYCFGLKSLDLSHFNTSNVTNIDYMFSWCTNLEELDIRNFNVNNNIEYINCMFEGCNELHTLRLDNCGYDTINKIITSGGFPTGQAIVDGEYINRKMYVQEANIIGLIAPEGWEFVYVESSEGGEEEPEIYVPGYYRSNTKITEATTMVNNTHTDLGNMFENCTNLTTINNIEQWDTSNVTTMRTMFYSCISLETLDLSNFDTRKVTSMSNIFNRCISLETLNISNFDMNKVGDTRAMFKDCASLRELRLDNCNRNTIEKIINSTGFPTDVIEGVTRKIYVNPDNIDGLMPPTNWIFVDLDGNEIVPEPEIDIPLYVSGEFQNKTGLTEVTTMVNKSHTDLSNMFDCCYNLATINGIEQWDTSNVTKMNHLFNYCQKLIELDLSSFNTSKVTTMYAMFRNCSNLKILDMRNFDMTNVTTDNFGLSMFDVCYELQELRLDNCSNDTISKIITSPGFPTGAILDVTRKIYCKQENAAGLTPPNGWVFEYIN